MTVAFAALLAGVAAIAWSRQRRAPAGARGAAVASPYIDQLFGAERR